MPDNPMCFSKIEDSLHRMLAENILMSALEESFTLEKARVYAVQDCAGGDLWLLEVDGAAIGTIGVRPVGAKPGLWEVFGLAVVRKWRRGGLASFMLGKIIEGLRQKQGTHLLARLNTAMESAGAFYAQYGFKQTVEPKGSGEYVVALKI